MHIEVVFIIKLFNQVKWFLFPYIIVEANWIIYNQVSQPENWRGCAL